VAKHHRPTDFSGFSPTAPAWLISWRSMTFHNIPADLVAIPAAADYHREYATPRLRSGRDSLPLNAGSCRDPEDLGNLANLAQHSP
jgi:hypothetical protein